MSEKIKHYAEKIVYVPDVFYIEDDKEEGMSDSQNDQLETNLHNIRK